MPIPARVCYNKTRKEGVPPEAAGERSLSPGFSNGAGSARRETVLRAAKAKRFVFHKQENTPQEKGE